MTRVSLKLRSGGKLAENEAAAVLCQLAMGHEKLKSVFRWHRGVSENYGDWSTESSAARADVIVSAVSLLGCTGEILEELRTLIKEGRIRRGMVAPDCSFWDECFTVSQSKNGIVVVLNSEAAKLLRDTRHNFDAHFNPEKKFIRKFLAALDAGKMDHAFVEAPQSSPSPSIEETRYPWGQGVFEHFLCTQRNQGQMRDETELRALLKETSEFIGQLIGLMLRLIGCLKDANPDFEFKVISDFAKA